MKNVHYILIGSFVITVAAGVILVTHKAYAGCESTYGGGEKCVYNKRFDIEKKVRLCDRKVYKSTGDCGSSSDWKDKVTGLHKGDIVEFKVKVKNKGEVEVDEMKMKDSFPKQMEKLSGDGLTEDWDVFGPGDIKTFNFFAKVDDSEFDTNKDFEKCVVNKAEVFYKSDQEASDTATVCYSDKEVTELPKTGGSADVFGALGLGSVALGAIVKKFRK